MKARAFSLAAACLLAITSRTAGQELDWQTEALRGLDGLEVVVENLPDPAHEGGVTRDALKTYLEMRLRQARLPVLSHHEWLASERHPTLYLIDVASRTAGGGPSSSHCKLSSMPATGTWRDRKDSCFQQGAPSL